MSQLRPAYLPWLVVGFSLLALVGALLGAGVGVGCFFWGRMVKFGTLRDRASRRACLNLPENFTDPARSVMRLASEEARRVNHEYVGTEHLLLALAKEGGGAAEQVLSALGVELGQIRVEIETILLAGPYTVGEGELSLTPRARKAVECAIEEARNLKHDNVGTEHLLLGLLREQEGVAGQVLIHAGLELEAVREEVRRLQDGAKHVGGEAK